MCHSGIPRPVDLARWGYKPLFSRRRGGHMSRGEAHPLAAAREPASPTPSGDNYAEVEEVRRRLDARLRLDAAKKQKKCV